MAGDLIPGEERDEVACRYWFRTVYQTGMMGQQTNYLFGSIALAKGSEVETLVALGESLTCFVAQQGDVVILRRGVAQEGEQILLLRYGEQKVSATDHLRDAHQCVIDYHGKLVSPCPVSTTENEIATLAGQIDRLLAIMAVNIGYVTVRNQHSEGGMYGFTELRNYGTP